MAFNPKFLKMIPDAGALSYNTNEDTSASVKHNDYWSADISADTDANREARQGRRAAESFVRTALPGSSGGVPFMLTDSRTKTVEWLVAILDANGRIQIRP